MGNLERYGLFTAPRAEGIAPNARVITAYEDRCQVMTDTGEREAIYSPRIGAAGWEDGVCAGDWVRAEEIPGGLMIMELLPRKTCLMRMAAGGKPRGQVIAANIDNALIVTSLNADYKPARVERYLAAAWGSGATPYVILSKADLCENAEALCKSTRDIAPGVTVVCVSAVTGEGMDALYAIMRNKTSALIGMSGVGKSSIINCLAGEERMRVNAIREDDARGRHTTTHREMMLIGDDIIVIDTPGMREMGLFDASGLSDTYADIEALAARCRFSDCRHDREPGCAVRSAVEEGSLSARRLRNYQTLKAQFSARARKAPSGKRPIRRADAETP